MLFKPYDMQELERLMEEALQNAYNSTKTKDKDYFKREYWRLKELYDTAVSDWVAIL